MTLKLRSARYPQISRRAPARWRTKEGLKGYRLVPTNDGFLRLMRVKRWW